ncbi:hypothetical protein ACFQO1_02900 [Jejudonia soesokkakensis]|uniref:Glycine dehydrogenase n=1 Tax=Jejudonia soesokkakensis TaxID=1323432 RepID=A0ABW2MSC6_9FLAO
MKVFLNCNEAQQVCDKNQYREASFWQKVKLNIHLIYCAICRKYTVRNNKLTSVFKNSNVTTMPKNDKEVLKRRLHQEIIKQQH